MKPNKAESLSIKDKAWASALSTLKLIIPNTKLEMSLCTDTRVAIYWSVHHDIRYHELRANCEEMQAAMWYQANGPFGQHSVRGFSTSHQLWGHVDGGSWMSQVLRRVAVTEVSGDYYLRCCCPWICHICFFPGST